MATAQILLEDSDGVVACRLLFDGGWKRDSHAHQHAKLMLDHLDSICTRQSEPEIINADVEEARIVLARS